MNRLFSENSLKILESLSFTNTLYAFDFDGTLTPIAKTPSEVSLSKITETLLRELCQLVPVAVVSGRSIQDLTQYFRFSPRYIVGNHGLEINGYNPKALREAKNECAKWRGILEKFGFPPGVELEDKSFSLCLHYRKARNKNQARRDIEKVLKHLRPAPRIIGGKCVVNILPLAAPHKGVAVQTLMEKSKSKHAFYIGDDITDEDVFAFPNEHIMTVRVGQKRNSQAQFYIDRQFEINKLLRLLIQYHQPQKPNRRGA